MWILCCCCFEKVIYWVRVNLDNFMILWKENEGVGLMSSGITVSVKYHVIRSMQYQRIHLVLVTLHPLPQMSLIFNSCMEIKTLTLKMWRREAVFIDVALVKSKVLISFRSLCVSVLPGPIPRRRLGTRALCGPARRGAPAGVRPCRAWAWARPAGCLCPAQGASLLVKQALRTRGRHFLPSQHDVLTCVSCFWTVPYPSVWPCPAVSTVLLGKGSSDRFMIIHWCPSA